MLVVFYNLYGSVEVIYGFPGYGGGRIEVREMIRQKQGETMILLYSAVITSSTSLVEDSNIR